MAVAWGEGRGSGKRSGDAWGLQEPQEERPETQSSRVHVVKVTPVMITQLRKQCRSGHPATR